MQRETVQYFEGTSLLAPGNIGYIEQSYEQYLRDPQSVSAEWRDYFDSLSHKNHPHESILSEIREKFIALGKSSARLAISAAQAEVAVSAEEINKIEKQNEIEWLIQAFRELGHYQAKLDPLHLAPIPQIPELTLEYYGFNSADLDIIFEPTSFMPDQKASLRAIYSGLVKTYSSSIGTEFAYIADQEEVLWIQQRLESTHGQLVFSAEQKKHILKLLIWAEELERYLSARFVGQTRFSLEGGSSLIPLLDELIRRAGSQDVQEVIIGMGHRGRLSVLVNILGFPVERLFGEFAKKPKTNDRSGDVKYHLGFSSNLKTGDNIVHTALAFNPSHLEIVDPVVEGAVRARQDRRIDRQHEKVEPVLIHGDAAFAGQGIVMETLNLSQARGFATGGTVHIIVNNQIGFTTSSPSDSRSTWYCTDVAKSIQAPIFHVNGDDPEAVIYVTQLAHDFRMRFKKDVVIDFVCYRRLGHNEADEPSATQPLMYKAIKQLPRTWEIYAEKLQVENVIDANYASAEINAYRKALDDMKELVERIPNEKSGQIFADWRKYKDQEQMSETKFPFNKTEFTKLAENITRLPEGFVLQAQVAKEYEARREMITGATPINWGFAEAMAFASLLDSGYNIRLSGQDVGRGTFAHRHAVLHDQNKGETYIPLQHINSKETRFNVFDSTLSEAAVLGFEYGFATTDPDTLVIWEAQYGDFFNGAQVVIDQFITSGEQKWKRLCGLTMFLPHGYEGAGPEHSSARLERFLQSSAQQNIQICVPSTPAQMFHMLRRQMLRVYRKPLVVFTPKSLLRNKLSTSSIEDLTQGQFKLLIPEIDDIPIEKCRRLIFCSGKVYYDLLKQRRENNQSDVALIRIEQLYPFPTEEVKAVLSQYAKVKEIFWCQEESKNQGAWYSITHWLIECLAKGQSLGYLGRPPSAAPATGYSGVHQEEQAKLVAEALNI